MTKKKSKPGVLQKVNNSKPSLVKQLAEELNTLKAQVKERDIKLDQIDKTQKNSQIGRQRFGASDWEKWTSGREKGYHRTIYVDINSMSTPRPS